MATEYTQSVNFSLESEEMQALLKKANGGDAEAIQQLHTFVKNNPEIWKVVGNMGLHAKTAWIELIAGSDRLMVESLNGTFVERVSSLMTDTGSPLERMSAERVALTWLSCNYHETQVAQKRKSGGLTEAQAKSQLNLLEQAQKLHFQALKEHATISKLLGKSAKRKSTATPKAETPRPKLWEPQPEPGNENSTGTDPSSEITPEEIARQIITHGYDPMLDALHGEADQNDELEPLPTEIDMHENGQPESTS
jgi:hypothetical protein